MSKSDRKPAHEVLVERIEKWAEDRLEAVKAREKGGHSARVLAAAELGVLMSMLDGIIIPEKHLAEVTSRIQRVMVKLREAKLSWVPVRDTLTKLVTDYPSEQGKGA